MANWKEIYNSVNQATKKKKKNEEGTVELKASDLSDGLRQVLEEAAFKRRVKEIENNLLNTPEFATTKKAEQELAQTAHMKQFENARNNVENAPVMALELAKKERSSDRTWFKNAGLFDDGYQVGDLWLTAASSLQDGLEEITEGAWEGAENLIDTGAYLYGGAASLFGFDDVKEDVADFIARDIIDSEHLAKNYNPFFVGSIPNMAGIDVEDASIFGDRSESLANSGGQLLTQVGLKSVGVPWWVTSGVTSFGSATEQQLDDGASYGQAGGIGLVNAGAEILTEKLFGDSILGEKGLIDMGGLTKGISNKALKLGADYGLTWFTNGTEEVASEVLGRLGESIIKEENPLEILTNEEALDAYLESFIGGMVMSGVTNAPKAVRSHKTGTDYNTGLNANEEAVVNKEVEKRIAEQEKNGKNVSKAEKGKIWQQVVNEMDEGSLSIDSIEEVLGGDTYKTYKDTIASEESTLKEFQELYQGEELEQQIKDLRSNSKLGEIKKQLGSEVFNKVKNSRLSESYIERGRRGQKFTADPSKYDEKQGATIQKAIDSGILNNTRRTHKFVDWLAKVTADKGVLFDFVNNEKLKNSGFAIEGKTVNGFKTKDGITLNVQSSKMLESTVGHEIAHVLEGTELYDIFAAEIENFARSRKTSSGKFDNEHNEYLERLYNTRELYKDVKGYKDVEGHAAIKQEVIADLVGDYLFTDNDFIMNLSAKNRNLFQKMYDEIKYLYKTITAGSAEAERLLAVKKAFEDAYRAGSNAQKNTTNDGGVKYAIQNNIVDTNGNVYNKVVKPGLTIYNKVKHDNKDYIHYLEDHIYPRTFSVPALDGTTIKVEFAKDSDRIQKDGDKSPRKVRGELSSADTKLKKVAILNIRDIIKNSEPLAHKSQNNHQWLDANGWSDRKAYMRDGDNIYPVIIHIANAHDGRHVLYDVSVLTDEGSTVDIGATALASLSDDGTSSSRENESKLAVKSIEPSGEMLAQEDPKVKRQFSLSTDSNGREVSIELQDRLQFSQVRDESGRLKPMFHGTPNGDYADFKAGTYFTENKEYADRYQNTGASSISSGKTASAPKTFEVYLDIRKPFDLSDPEAKRIYIEDYIKGGNAIGINPYLSDAEYDKINTIDWTEGEDLRDFLVENGYDYDGLVLDEGADGGYGEDVKYRGKSYVIFSPDQAVKIDSPEVRFSLSEAVEETKDLMALHNLHTNELLKQLGMGGLIYPSVAITDPSKIAHEDFGDITAILHRDAVDPKTSKYNHIYSSDAYTPTFPHVSYEANSEVADNVIARVNAQFDKLPDYYQRSLRSLRDYTNLNDVLNRHGGFDGLVANYVDDHGMKQLYLAEKGENVPMVIDRAEKEMTDYQKALYQSVVDRIGEDEIRSLSDRGYFNTLGEARIAWTKEHLDVLKDIYAEDWSADGTMTKTEALEIANEQKLFYWYKEASSALEYLENGGLTVVEKENLDATNAKVDEKIADSDYKQWLNNLFGGIEGQSGIRNNKDTFLPSGKRRNFAQLHDPVTIDNVIKVMRKKDQTGQGGVGGNLYGASVQEYGSIAEAKRNSNMLGVIDDAKYKDIKQSIDDELFDIASRYANGKDIIDARNAIIEAVAKSESKAGIARYLQQYDYVFTYTDEIGNDIIALRDRVRSLPRPYFEAKPRRAVGFDEVAVFVIPRNADPKLKQELLNKGYSIAEYDPDVEGDRNKVVNQFEEYKFSLSNIGETPKTYGNFGTYGSDIALEEDLPIRQDVAAPVAETPAVEDDIPVAETVEDPLPDNLPMADDELDSLTQQKEALEEKMLAMSEKGDFGDEFYQLNEQWVAVTERAKALESEIAERDADYMDSFDDADAPPIAEQYNDSAVDVIPITKKLESDIARDVRGRLGITDPRKFNAVRDIIREYSQNEMPSRDDLADELRGKFGSYTESTHSEEMIREAKKFLRSVRIKVDDTIKGDIADFDSWRKGNRNRLRFSDEGTAVDQLYHDELSPRFPGLFPEYISNPTDELLQIEKVANMDDSITETINHTEEEIYATADAIIQAISEYRGVQREKSANKSGRDSFDSLMQDADQYVPPVNLEQVLRNRWNPIGTENPDAPAAEIYDTQHKKGVAEGQQAMWNDPVPKVITRKTVHEDKVNEIKTGLASKGIDLDTILDKAKRMHTITINDNTPQRVNDKTFGYEAGEALNDLMFNKQALHVSYGTKWENEQVVKIREMSKKYGIKPKSKESAAAMMYAEGFYVNGKGEYIAYGDAELKADFPTKWKRIKAAAQDPTIRQMYDATLDAMNESRRRNAYPEIPRRDNYYMHYMEMGDFISKWGIPFNPESMKAKDLPTDINGKTADLKPGQPFFSSSMQRKGDRTAYDLFGGLEKYIHSAMPQIYLIDDIQTERALWEYIANRYGQGHGLENLDELSPEAQAERIKQVYDGHLSNYARFLNEHANHLAGKTALMDRTLEGLIGRRGLQAINTINQQAGRNQVGYSVSSAGTNLLPMMETIARTPKQDCVKAFAQQVSNIFKKDGFADNDPALIRRKGADKFTKTMWEKLSDPGYILMGAVDSVTSEFIVRAKYNQYIREGMDSEQAHIKAGQWAMRVMGDRSTGQMPLLYNSKTLGIFTKYQLEVRNFLDSAFYDTIKEAEASTKDVEEGLARNAKTAAKATWKIAQIAFLNHLFGTAYEKIAGYNPAFDIISVLTTLFGLDDDEEDEDTFGDNLEQAFQELLGDLPYTSLVTGGGRIPMSDALPIKEFITNQDEYGQPIDDGNLGWLTGRLKTVGKALPYALPGGYGQFKKTVQGLKMFDDDLPIAGSYTDSGDLRFPVEDTFGNRLQAGIFGQWASENARDYFDNERDPLKEKQVQEFIDVDIPIRDYWEYREGLSDHDTLSEKADYIDSLDLPISKKNILINNIADRKESINMKDYGKYGSFEEFDFAEKNPEKYKFLQDRNISWSKYVWNKEEYNYAYNNTEMYDFLQENGVSYKQYKSFDEDTKDAFSWAKENPGKYAVSKAISRDFLTYYGYKKDLGELNAKDANGNTVSGLKKQRVFDYIENLDLDYGEKIILYRSMYDSKSDKAMYNADILEYLNSRKDLSYAEKKTILEELDFKVSADGTVTW